MDKFIKEIDLAFVGFSTDIHFFLLQRTEAYSLAPIAAVSFCETKWNKRFSGKRDWFSSRLKGSASKKSTYKCQLSFYLDKLVEFCLNSALRNDLNYQSSIIN